MPARIATVPVSFKVFTNTTTNNPYIKNSVSVSDGLSVNTLTENTSVETYETALTDGAAVGTWADISGTNLRFKHLNGILKHNLEQLAFTLVFTANTGYHFNASGTLLRIRILEGDLANSYKTTYISRDSSQDTNINYANRWRFEEVRSNFDSNQLPKTVTLKAYYTTPDYRSEDAIQQDGSAITTDLEKAKNRGLYIVPMLKKSTTAIAATINDLIFEKVNKDTDGTQSVLFSSLSANKPILEVRGTAGATGILHGEQVTGTAFNLTKSFTLDSSGLFRQQVSLPAVSSDEFKFYIQSSATLTDNVPKITNKKSIHKFADITIRLALKYTTSSSNALKAVQTTSTSTQLVSGTDYNIVTGSAFKKFNRSKMKALATENARYGVGPTTDHRTLTEEMTQRASFYAFNATIEPASGGTGKVVIEPKLLKGRSAVNGIYGPITPSAAQTDSTTNGGTVASIRNLFIIQESGANARISGFVAVQKLGKTTPVDFEIDLDEYFNN